MRSCALLAAALMILPPLVHAKARDKKPRLIIWSIDGFAAGYLKQPRFTENENWQYLLAKAKVYGDVETTVPSVTYAAHTSMVTGVHPARHGIRSNHPVDPFNLAKGGWTWFMEDVHGNTLWDIARDRGKHVANIMWPVTMTRPGRIRWHVPQFDRAKGPEEAKLMRVLSTPGLHSEIEKATGVSLTEYSTDRERLDAALWVWEKKKPDLMFLYHPGLDATEHASGPYSAAAYAQLDDLGKQAQLLLRRVRRPGHENTAVLIVSDHGFLTFKGKCFPNTILLRQGHINAEAKTWSYYFETAGGVARLVKSATPGRAFDAAAFSAAISKECPSIEYIARGHEQFEYLRSRYSPDTEAFLVSRSNVVMGPAWGAEAFDEAATGHTHGFLPFREDMKTVALVFSGRQRKTVPIRHVKDTYSFACSWLRLKCPVQKSAETPKKRP